MSNDRGTIGSHLALGATAVATACAAMLSWRGFTAPPYDFLTQLVVVALVVGLVGALGRWRRVPGGLVLLLQLVLGSAVVCAYVAGAPYPTAGFWEAVRAALDDANFYAAPVPFGDGVTVQPLLLIGGFAAVLLVDLLACTLRKVPLAGLPLLTVYSVPVSMLDTGISWIVFAATAFGYLLLLFLQEQEHVARWGRSLDGTAAPTRRSEAVRGSALGVAAVAVAVAVVAPTAVPSIDLSVFDVGKGKGGDDEISIVNPLVDLRRDLNRGVDVDLITITAPPGSPEPTYLRISVLNRFSDNEFSSGDRDVPAANSADGAQMPPFPGADPSFVRNRGTDTYSLQVDDAFDSRWLPTLESTSSVDATGDWRFDETTRDFLASEDDLSTRGISYSFRADELEVSEGAFDVAAGAESEVDPEVLALPEGVVSDLQPYLEEAFGLSGLVGVSTPYEKAVALQKWFRTLGGFTYDIEAVDADRQIGSDQLISFLSAGRRGYCEQFAAAMTIMARAEGIPARVAVGFLEPDEVGPSTWVYSAHDLHAWPELYFPDAGWVRFDPTPGTRVPNALLPDYSRVRLGDETPTTAPPSSQTPPPSSSAVDPRPTRTPTTAPPRTDADAPGTDTGIRVPWALIGWTLLVVLVLAALVLAPRTLRRRQRARRLAGGPESAWEELRATSRDLFLPWPEGRSPHEVELVVAASFGQPGSDDERPATGPSYNPDAVASLDRIVRQLERLRYASAWSGEPGALADDVQCCVDALTAGATPRVRRRAAWLPRSVFQRRRPVVEPAGPGPGPEDRELVGVVEHL